PITELEIGGEKIGVRELRWPDFMSMMAKLGAQAGKFIQGNELKITPEQIGELIAQSQELTETLILKSTSRDKEWLAQRSFADALKLLDASLSVNMSPEMTAQLKKVGGRLRAVLGVKAA